MAPVKTRSLISDQEVIIHADDLPQHSRKLYVVHSETKVKVPISGVIVRADFLDRLVRELQKPNIGFELVEQ